MDHAELISELPVIEKMTPAERIALARERRALQLQKNLDRERAASPPPPRKPRLTFGAEIALLEATSRGDADEVERLLVSDGANPNSHNEDGLTPLHQCAIDNNEQILRLLLAHGADVNSQDTEQWTPLHAAACCAHIDIVRLLIASGANLLAVNADGNMPYDICDDDATLDVIESEMAAQGITQTFIDEERGAAEARMLNDMKLLHQQGLPLDARQPDGSTYLHMAAANGYYDVAAFLLRCGVSPSVRDNDLWQPTHAAACWAQPDLVELLSEYGGDINAKTNSGETPLELCEDQTTRAIIVTVQQQEARKRRQAFGVRDSRRQSRKRKKFESPQQPTATSDSPFSARGAIRRLSLRDRSGMTLARLEAQKEQTDILRSWSKEDISSKPDPPPKKKNLKKSASDSVAIKNDVGLPGTSKEENGVNVADVKVKDRSRDSPSKRVKGGKTKAMSPDEWLKKLEAEEQDDDEPPPDQPSGGSNGHPQRTAKTRTSGKKKKTTPGAEGTELAALKDSASNGDANAALAALPSDGPLKQFRNPKGELIGPSPSSGKDCCQCCTIL